MSHMMEAKITVEIQALDELLATETERSIVLSVACFLEDLIDQNRLVLVSPPSLYGWHIAPVFERDSNGYKLLWVMKCDGVLDILLLPRHELIRVHDALTGGRDIAWLSQ